MEGQYPKGEYIDFCFNGKWGSEMGLTRICNGNRNQEDLLPSIKDRATDIPGRDGQYHFYSTFDKKQFTINYAFDTLTEAEVDRIKAWLGDKKLHQLYFSEDSEVEEGEWKPKKYYMAKVTSQSILKYIPFDNDISSSEDGDIYKGEGSIQFTCYYPFARKQGQSLTLEDNNFLNVNSYIKFVSQEDINSNILFDGDQNSYVEIGDSYIIPQTCAPMPWKLIIKLSNVEDVATLQIDNDTYNINFNKLPNDILTDKNNYRIIFNSKKGTIEAQKGNDDDGWETVTQSSKYHNRVGLPVLFNRIIDNKTLKPIPKGNNIDISLSVSGTLYWEEVAY